MAQSPKILTKFVQKWPTTPSLHQMRSKRDGLNIFSDLLNINSETDESVLDELEQLPVKEELDHPITESELEKALNNTKLGKSPGLDGILPEILVYGAQTLKKFLFALLTIFWTTQVLPEVLSIRISLFFSEKETGVIVVIIEASLC